MGSDLILAIIIGLLVLGAVYLALDVVFPSRDRYVHRVKVHIAGAGGLLVAITLQQNPALLQKVSGQLLWMFLAILVGLLALLRIMFRR